MFGGFTFVCVLCRPALSHVVARAKTDDVDACCVVCARQHQSKNDLLQQTQTTISTSGPKTKLPLAIALSIHLSFDTRLMD